MKNKRRKFMKALILSLLAGLMVNNIAKAASVSVGVSTVTKTSERDLYTPTTRPDGVFQVVHKYDKETETKTVPTIRLSESFKLNTDLCIELGIAYNEVKTTGYINTSLNLSDRFEAYAGINQALENGLGAQVGVNYLVGGDLSVFAEVRQEKEHYRPDWSEHKEITYNSTNFGFKVGF